MKDDIVYIQSLRDRAIGFEMEAFYDDLLKKMRDARFRQMMNEFRSINYLDRYYFRRKIS